MFDFIFITGAGRCGTNLMGGLIDGHPKIDVLPGEPTNYLGMVLRYNGLSTNVNIALSGQILLQIFTAEYEEDDDYKEIKKRLDKKFFDIEKKGVKNLSANYFLSSICEAIFMKESGIAVVNLQDENISGLLEAFPECKIIHMLRNPFTQINSRYLWRYRNPNNYMTGEFGESFMRNYNSFQQADIFSNHKQVKIVRMEDVQKNTQNVLSDVFNFLKIDILPVNLTPSRRGNAFRGSRNGVMINTKHIFASSEDWSCLSPNDLYWCSQIEIMRKFYDVPKFLYAKNRYLFFLFRHLGFVGKNRKKTWNPIKILKLIIGSIYLFLQDKRLKLTFNDYLRSTTIQEPKN